MSREQHSFSSSLALATLCTLGVTSGSCLGPKSEFLSYPTLSSAAFFDCVFRCSKGFAPAPLPAYSPSHLAIRKPQSACLFLKGGDAGDSSPEIEHSATWKDDESGIDGEGEEEGGRPSLFEAAKFEEKPAAAGTVQRLTEDGRLNLDWDEGLTSSDCSEADGLNDREAFSSESSFEVVPAEDLVENWAYSIEEASQIHKPLPHAEAQRVLGLDIDTLYQQLPTPQLPPPPANSASCLPLAPPFSPCTAEESAALARDWELAGGADALMGDTATYLRNRSRPSSAHSHMPSLTRSATWLGWK